MKKIFSLVIAVGLMLSVFAGCGSTENNLSSNGSGSAPAERPVMNFNEFETVDAEGNTVTQEIFADYDITMINMWTTWCYFCVEEMPELQKVYESLPENVNMITLCADSNDAPDAMKDILEQSGAEFTTLQVNDELMISAIQYLRGFPSTAFVDKEGNIIGGIISGVPGGKDKVVESYLKLIENALAEVNK